MESYEEAVAGEASAEALASTVLLGLTSSRYSL